MDKFIINESKRDDLLLQYVELLNNNGINVNLGQVKSKLLNKFVVEGNIHNLSLRSNFYLSGVARYYFNGSLTMNKDLSLLKKEYWEGQDIQDKWNVDVCIKINALINVLRNAYIDTIGKELIEPEDFGELPLKDLLRKYKNEINKEIGVKTSKKTNQTLDMNENVGNGYTFEIMYSYEDCQKYQTPTSPGSWCITYGQQHYNSYVKMLGIHYVIFRMNGWEKVQRPENPLEEEGFTPQKPHDLYGNSLIAVLQSNTSPEPVYITSRWNHGYEVRCEADHAYTKEEFEAITGVSDEDLERIFQIWKTTKSSRTGNAFNKKESMFVLRSLKYLQMRINAGENPEKLFEIMNNVFGSKKANKGTFVCSAKISETTMGVNEKIVYFIYDNGKIVFESITMDSASFKHIQDFGLWINFSVDKYSIYSYYKHKMVNVEGVSVFKRIPSRIQFKDFNNGNIDYFTVNQGKFDAALIDASTMEPLQLPNGAYWFNFIVSSLPDWDYSEKNNKINCHVYDKRRQSTRYFDIIYDMSSCEKYFYDTKNKRFFEIKTPDVVPYQFDGSFMSSNGIVPMFADKYTETNDDILPINFGKPSKYGLEKGQMYASGSVSKMQFYRDGAPITINGNSWFTKIKYFNYSNLLCIAESYGNFFLTDKSFKHILCDDNNNPIRFYNSDESKNFIVLRLSRENEHIMIFDLSRNSFLTNIFQQDNINNDCVFDGYYTFFYDAHRYTYGFEIYDSKIPSNKIPNDCVMRGKNFKGQDTLEVPEDTLLKMCGRKQAVWCKEDEIYNQNSIKINNNDIKQMVSEVIFKIKDRYAR